MRIQWWEGAALSRAEAVLQGTTHDTVCAEIGYGERVSQRPWSKKLEEGIGLTLGHKDAERPEGRRVFELERVVSCRRADPWWRAKLNFGSGEPFDDLHRSTAFRAAPQIGTVFGGRGVLFCLRLLFRTQQLLAKTGNEQAALEEYGKAYMLVPNNAKYRHAYERLGQQLKGRAIL